MTALPDPNALLQMARALGLHPVVTHAPDSEVIAAVRVYRTELDNRAIVTWEATGLVRRDGPSWVPCSRAEAAAVLKAASVDAPSDESGETEMEYWRRLAFRVVGEREALRDIIGRCLAKVPLEHSGCLETAIDLLLTERQDVENAVATAQIDAECSGIEVCGCDEAQWWKNHAARLTRNVVGLEGSVSHLAANEEFLESEVARFSARLCEEQGKALDLERELHAAEVATMMARDNAQRWKNAAEETTAELVLSRQALADRAGAPGEHDALPHERGWICEQSVWWHREAARLAKELKAAQVAAATPETTLESRPHAREFALAKIEESLGDRDIEGDRWLQTITGAPFFFFDPHPDDFDIYVIAHALSNQCRFNGHTKRFYSVAEHSVLVATILRDQGEPVPVQLAGLLHDAAEAYIGDMVRPLKVALPAYKAVEERIERALAERFDLPWPWPAAVKEADNIALALEKRDLLAEPPRPWRGLPDASEYPRIDVNESNYRKSFVSWFDRLSMERRNGS